MYTIIVPINNLSEKKYPYNSTLAHTSSGLHC
jgi:hypothetical protein